MAALGGDGVGALFPWLAIGPYIGCRCQDFGSGGASGASSVRRASFVPVLLRVGVEELGVE